MANRGSLSAAAASAESYVLHRILQPAAIAAGVGHVTWRQLRHHSTMLHDPGAPAKAVQEQLGHASLATTLNVHTHAVEDSRRPFGNRLERLLCSRVVPKSKRGILLGRF